jgi:hypothetical protein
VNILTLGQYLRPSDSHMPVARYYTPDEFAELREHGLALGFTHVESSPLTRSSYHAWEQVTSARGRGHPEPFANAQGRLREGTKTPNEGAEALHEVSL